MTEYKLIQIDVYDPEDAYKEIERLTAKGWELYGSPSAVTGVQYIYQAIVHTPTTKDKTDE